MFNPNGADNANVNLESSTPVTGGLYAKGLQAFPGQEQL